MTMVCLGVYTDGSYLLGVYTDGSYLLGVYIDGSYLLGVFRNLFSVKDLVFTLNFRQPDLGNKREIYCKSLIYGSRKLSSCLM